MATANLLTDIRFGLPRRTVLVMVSRQGAKLVAAGIVIGLLGAYVVARALAALLFGVAPLDWPLFAAVTTFLAVVAIVASIVHAVRAGRIDPNALLRA